MLPYKNMFAIPTQFKNNAIFCTNSFCDEVILRERWSMVLSLNLMVGVYLVSTGTWVEVDVVQLQELHA